MTCHPHPHCPSHSTASGCAQRDPVSRKTERKGGLGEKGRRMTLAAVSVAWGPVGDAQRQAGQRQGREVWTLDEPTFCRIHAPGCVLRAFSPVSLLVLTRARQSTDFTEAAGAQAQPSTPRPGPAPGPGGVPTAPRRTGAPARAGLRAPRVPGAPLNRADNDPRFPRQAFCCLVSLDLCGPSLSQLVPFCHRDKGLPRLVCTCVAFGSFRNALKLVISFVKPLSARLSETSKARGKLAC